MSDTVESSDRAEPLVRVLLAVSDHFLSRGLRAAIGEHPDLMVAGVAETEGDLLVALGAHTVDVVAADTRLSTAMIALRHHRLVERDPAPRLLSLLPARSQSAEQILAAGADAAIVLGNDGDALADAIRGACLRNGARLPLPLVRAVASPTFMPGTVTPEDEDLTRRERQILDRVAMGLRNREIALDLHITESTVKGHVSRILDKLRVNARTQAVRIAVRRGLVSLDAN